MATATAPMSSQDLNQEPDYRNRDWLDMALHGLEKSQPISKYKVLAGQLLCKLYLSEQGFRLLPDFAGEIEFSKQKLNEFIISSDERNQELSETTDASDIVDSLCFNLLKEEWYKERGATSSITKMAMCTSYQQIIKMGEKALPLILQQLKIEGDEPDMWFWALSKITDADPVTEDIRGDVVKMSQAWLEWGRTCNAG